MQGSSGQNQRRRGLAVLGAMAFLVTALGELACGGELVGGAALLSSAPDTSGSPAIDGSGAADAGPSADIGPTGELGPSSSDAEVPPSEEPAEEPVTPAPPDQVILVYTDARSGMTLSTEAFTPLVTVVDEKGAPQQPLFDTFLFVGLQAGSGRGLCPGFGSGQATSEDFTWFLDHLFATGKQVSHLDEAIAALPARLQQQVKVVLTIPFPSTSLSSTTRTSLVKSFISGARQRFAAAGFQHLELQGFYWIKESVPSGDYTLVATAAKEVHAQGQLFYWIPYYSDANLSTLDNWKGRGFDRVYLQPNYAFRNVGTDRFSQAQSARKQHGVAIEMELARYTRNRPESPAWKPSFRAYLAAALKYGWMELSTMAYYFGNDFSGMARSATDYPYYVLLVGLVRHTLTSGALSTVSD